GALSLRRRAGPRDARRPGGGPEPAAGRHHSDFTVESAEGPSVAQWPHYVCHGRCFVRCFRTPRSTCRRLRGRAVNHTAADGLRTWVADRSRLMNFEKYTDRARGFVQSAQSLALREGHQQFAPEHLLKVLLDDPEGMSAGLIDRSGGNSRQAHQAVEAALAK